MQDRCRGGVRVGHRVACGLWLAALTARIVAPSVAWAQCDAHPTLASVVAAIFSDSTTACDLTGDGVINAADLPALVTALLTPQPTSTDLPSASATPSTTPSATPTPTVTATAPSPTPTPPMCPTAGANLVVEIDNQSGVSPLSVELSGERLTDDCQPGTLPVSYRADVSCAGTGIVTCGQLSALAAGVWRHSLRVFQPKTGQLQHQVTLLVADSVANRVRFTAFASVRVVRSAANGGSGSLRRILQFAGGVPKPLLIQFDPIFFPDGVPTIIRLTAQLPTLVTSDVTIDGTDATGTDGNRIVDANDLPIGALAITGARNHIIGMRFQNVGANNRDVLNISGPAAVANLIERTVIHGSATADGIGVDNQAGQDFGDSANVIRDCDISGANDKGVKVTLGAFARVEQCWVHDNVNGGIQATLGGHVQAVENLVEGNTGGMAQNGLSVIADDTGAAPTGFSLLFSRGDISRRNGANGLSALAYAVADVQNDYLADNASSGIRVFNDVGPPATAVVSGTSAVCNGVDGAVVADTSRADFGGGPLGSAGNNAFTENNLPMGGANLRNATADPVWARNDQWQHCGHDTTCDDAAIAAYDLSDHGANTRFTPAQAHRSQQPPVLTGVAPAKGQQGTLLRVYGSGFNVIDGHFSFGDCGDVSGRNRCLPLRGNCVLIGDVPAPVEAVTPTMLVVRWPFTCVGPLPLTVTIDQGAGGATSAPITVCTNGANAASGGIALP